jgi:L-ascorbate metabolism protein UlaG (beta-lactamase superfamily)
MSIEITWLGHATWLVETDKHQLLVDPFLDDNPAASCKSADVSPNFILVTHGHFDHVADAVKIATRTGATVIAMVEICAWLKGQGLEKTQQLNLGGGVALPFGHVKMTLAHHSSLLPDGSPAGSPAGFLLTLDGAKRLYFAGDTALFLDMQLIGAKGLDLVVLPIGDLFTMGPEDSIEAIKLLKPRHVAPCHYNTWPLIRQDAKKWAEQVRAETEAEPHVLEPGGKFAL